jgi:heterotetrameric sarcosine oxidase gamma subunit
VTDLQAITALGAFAPFEIQVGNLTIRENTNLALASLSVSRGQGVPMLMGMTLPDVGQCAVGSEVSAFWTAPNQWFIEGQGRAHEDFAASVKTAAPECFVTEQTDGWVAFDVYSDNGIRPVEGLLEKLVNIDVDGLKDGTAVRTGLHHMSVYLIRRGDTHVTIMGMRTFAAALCHAIESTAAGLR